MSKKRKNDIILIIFVLAVATLIWVGYLLAHKKPGGKVVITVDKEVYATYDLGSDTEVVVIDDDGNITNHLVIKDGIADMISADCPDKLCVHQKAISGNGEMIVCLPNKVIVTVKDSDSEADFDTVAK